MALITSLIKVHHSNKSSEDTKDPCHKNAFLLITSIKNSLERECSRNSLRVLIYLEEGFIHLLDTSPFSHECYKQGSLSHNLSLLIFLLLLLLRYRHAPLPWDVRTRA